MRRSIPAFLLSSLLVFPAVARAQEYAFGDYCTSCGGSSAANQFYDDGLHDDGAAGDGVFGAIVTVDKPAGGYRWWADSANHFSMTPSCWCTTGGWNPGARVYTTGPGDVIHF